MKNKRGGVIKFFFFFFQDDLQSSSNTLSAIVDDNGRVVLSKQVECGNIVRSDEFTEAGLLYLSCNTFSNTLNELEDLINDPHTLERDLQMFFEKHPDLLKGVDYDVVIPQAIIVYDKEKSSKEAWKADFVLTPCQQNEFAKILELKIPSMEMFNRPCAGHANFSAILLNAIQQIKDYKNAFNEERVREKFNQEYGVEIYKPALQIIAGRTNKNFNKRAFLNLQAQEHIKIETWDMALERLRKKYLK